ncbi:MAG: hypothetical protein CMM46_10405 [Rhodospirillaceae bacterium]|nr:hypothetical protein [Rhodospirillaceae bacterium]
MGVVHGLKETARDRFDSMTGIYPDIATLRGGCDAFKHVYASGVMTLVLDEDLARLAGRAVELAEQEPCRQQTHNLINNAVGRGFAQTPQVRSAKQPSAMLAEYIAAALVRPDTELSLDVWVDPRLQDLCASD